MHISHKVLQHQAQSSVLNANMRQAIELLELSYLDLQRYVEQQVVDNPFLELDPYHGDSEMEDGEIRGNDEDITEEYYENVWQTSDKCKRISDDFESSIDHIEAQHPSLKEHLLSQINVSFIATDDRILASQLVDYLEDTGYLITPTDTIAQELKVSVKRLNSVIMHLKSLEPCGIFASNLYECLAIQLQEKGLWDDKTSIILENISLFAEAKVALLQKKCNCTEEELYEVIEKIKSLNPKPAMSFSVKDPVAYVVPDIFVKSVRTASVDYTHEWLVRLNNGVLPKVLINNDYVATNNIKDKELRKYYQERMSSANFLIKAIDTRAQNILLVAKEIVNYQRDFFEHGVNKLKPMTLKQIAELTDLHESTISRITQNKYISCSQGAFAMKYFFNANVTNTWNGEQQSSLYIQYKIKKLIQHEDPISPLSDDNIVKTLSYDNIDIARRTVSKYRDLLNIPTSYERKKNHLRSRVHI